MKNLPWPSLPLLCSLACLPGVDARAAEFSASAFGTLGGAISDRGPSYQRSIDDNGTLMRDSLLGAQIDAKFNDRWAATAQMVLAPATDEDDVLEPRPKWTLLSYRPTNDWLIRAGRLSLGGLLNQQNMDVGVSYDMARLPNEVYLLSSAYDFDGLSIAKTWNTAAHEITLDASFGAQHRDYRGYLNASGRPDYFGADLTGCGLVLTVTDYAQAMYRAGWNLNEIDPHAARGIPETYAFIPLGGGLYTLGQPEYRATITINSLFLGARIPWSEFLISCEATALLIDDIDPAPTTVGAYINIARKLGNWTPYLTHARIWTNGMETWRRVKGATPVPGLVTQAAIDDLASSLAVYDQHSWMLGTAYAFTPKQKIKAEAMLTHVGERSAMVDGNLAHENVTVFSLSYNFAF